MAGIKSKMRTVAIIQARMGSSRLPGKVLMPLVGKPVLWHIVHRLRKCRSLDAIAIATSISSTDDPIVEFAFTEGIEITRGPEDNVLERYFLSAKQLKADIIVRVTGDAPLVDPAMVDSLVETLVANKADYCMSDPNVSCIHEGFCPCTFSALDKLMNEANNDPIAREHVTAYFKENPEFVKIACIPVDPDYQFSGARISVDTPADLHFLEEVYSHLNVPAGEADVRDVVRLLRVEPDLLRINAHIYRKGVDVNSRRFLFRCDGDTRIGLGHIYRCLALADELREGHGCGVSFAMSQGPVGFNLVQKAGYPIEYKPDESDEDLWLDQIIERLRPGGLVLDVRTDLSRSNVDKWRSNGLLIVTLDDPSDRRLAADLAFYPPVPQVQKMDWTGFTGEMHVGWEWVILSRKFAQPAPMKPHERPMVLVTMGGSDPAGLTLKAVEAIDLLDEDFETVLVLGPGFPHHEALKDFLDRANRKFEVYRNVDDMPGLMARADMAVASFGVTAYELAATGVPSLYLCLTEDHAQSASAFVEAGIGESLGVYTGVSKKMLAESIGKLIKDMQRRVRMADLSKKIFDGKGSRCIANSILMKLRG